MKETASASMISIPSSTACSKMKKILTALLCAFVICGCSSSKPENQTVIVPDFTGHNVREVYDWCGTLDESHSCEVSYADGNGVERDLVIGQSVKGGNRLEKDIFFTISK